RRPARAWRHRHLLGARARLRDRRGRTRPRSRSSRDDRAADRRRESRRHQLFHARRSHAGPHRAPHVPDPVRRGEKRRARTRGRDDRRARPRRQERRAHERVPRNPGIPVSDLDLRTRVLLYLYSTRNIVATALALAGPALLFTGVIRDYWLPITFGLYAVGWLLTPAPRIVDVDLTQALSVDALGDRLDAVIRRARPALPPDLA